MKQFKNLLLLLLLASLVLPSCKKEEDEPAPTKGNITVKCQISGDLGVILLKDASIECITEAGAAIGGKKRTDDKGEVSFSDLNPGNYVIEARWIDGNGFYYYGEAAAQLDAGQTERVTVELD